MAPANIDQEFPHSLTVNIPFPTHRLAIIALRSLAVDEELSGLVKRGLSLVSSETDEADSVDKNPIEASILAKASGQDEAEFEGSLSKLTIDDEAGNILRVHYKATTPRMLRVAVNGFFESLSVIVQVIEELDTDVLHEKGIEGLEGVQGVEQGLTGTAVGVGG